MDYKWENWSLEKILKTGEEIYDELNYKKILWTCGFIKTSISSALFVIGFTLIFNGLTKHPLFNNWNESAIFFGIQAIILALLIIYIIDKKREKMKKEELGLKEERIERRIYESREKQNQEIEKLIKEIAEDRIEKEIYKQLNILCYENKEYDSNWLEDLYND